MNTCTICPSLEISIGALKILLFSRYVASYGRESHESLWANHWFVALVSAHNTALTQLLKLCLCLSSYLCVQALMNNVSDWDFYLILLTFVKLYCQATSVAARNSTQHLLSCLSLGRSYDDLRDRRFSALPEICRGCPVLCDGRPTWYRTEI